VIQASECGGYSAWAVWKPVEVAADRELSVGTGWVVLPALCERITGQELP